MNHFHESLELSIILVEPQIPGNIGAVARLCKNYGVDNLVLISPQTNHLSDEARSRAKHAIDILERAKLFSSLLDIRQEFDVLIATSSKAGENYKVTRQAVYPWQLMANNISGRVGIVFGREDRGLLNEEVNQCDFITTIPVPGEHKVLNLSHSVAIFIHELWKLQSRFGKIKENERLATKFERNLLFQQFDGIVDIVSYEKHKKPIIKHTFHTLINRSYASHNEIFALIGIFREIRENLSKEEQ